MIEVTSLDSVVLGLVVLVTATYFKGLFKGVTIPPYVPGTVHANGVTKDGSKSTRDIVERMRMAGKNCVLFYGTQTGTAEDYVARLAKEGSQRFGLKTMMADLADYDFESLESFPEDMVAIFVLATYGEGEPTDNARNFFNFIHRDDMSLKLRTLKYIAFGLGNHTYEHYNAMVRNVDATLTKLGAQRIGTAGEGDDGAGTMEEDFLAWKKDMWVALVDSIGLQEQREVSYKPLFSVMENPAASIQHSSVYLGEPTQEHLKDRQQGPYYAHAPFIAQIVESRELFSVKDRHCLHVEIKPTNAGTKVDHFLKTFGLDKKRDTVIEIEGVDVTTKVPFPTPTTYARAVSYYMEICAPVSRQFISSLAQFAPDEPSKTEIIRLGNDKNYFHEKVTNQRYNIARTLQSITEKSFVVPFSLLVEGIHRLQPRYYSISSSSLVQKDTISITAVVESINMPSHTVKGVATNYLLALKEKQNAAPCPNPYGLTYAITGPRNKYDGLRIPVHVRHSNFKLPSDPSRPIIMVGPGTGVAPFRGFVQERSALASRGQNVGTTVLFFGCRNRNEDFLYKDEWKIFEKQMGGKFKLITAFSREGKSKIYVQHRLREQAALVDRLLRGNAAIYVCGDAAKMAREVHLTLSEIITEQRGLSAEKGEGLIKQMRSNGSYQEDVWS